MKVYSILAYKERLAEEGLLRNSFIYDSTIGISQITYKSKEAGKDCLFACKGAAFSPKYLDEAIQNGACCYVSETYYDITSKEVSYLIVSDVRRAMAIIATFFHDNAFEKLKLIGITGTKGKSTTVYYIKYILDEYLQENSKKPSGIISTIDYFDGKERKESHLTTPEAFELHEHFDNAVQNGLEFLEMEVSSQALKYDRVLGINFDVGVFLNFSEDHISSIEHSNLEDYLSSKLKLFSQTKYAVINRNTDYAERVLKAAKSDCNSICTFGLTEKADYYGYNIDKRGGYLSFMVKSANFDEEFMLTMPGIFNVENALAAIAVCDYFNIPVKNMKNGLKKARADGRMEIYTNNDSSVIAIVDYAHNKMSFEKLFETTIAEYPDRNITIVFGCPGGKALNRRKELGETASRYANRIFLTADHPNHEPISDIIEDIAQYIKPDAACFKIEDRAQAIAKAILTAPPNSIVLVAGKGSESFQVVDGKNVDYKTDAHYVRKFLLRYNAPIKIK